MKELTKEAGDSEEEIPDEFLQKCVWNDSDPHKGKLEPERMESQAHVPKVKMNYNRKRRQEKRFFTKQ